MTAVVVRALAPGDDHALLGDIVRRAYFALPEYPRDSEYDEIIADVAGRAAEEGATVAVAELDGVAVGCVTFVVPGGPGHEFADQRSASFRYFGVDPAVQGRGVGEAMVRWCIDRARAEGWPRLRIHTLESMPAARRLYERMGFMRDPASDEVWDGILGMAFVFDT